MILPKKILLITLITLCCGAFATGIYFGWPYIQKITGVSTVKATTPPPNSHFNKSKIQEILENDSLTRKQKALMLNNMGYQLYKKNRYGEAIEYFEFALEFDNTFIAAHHNLACALLKEDVDCNMIKAFNEIIFELHLDPARKSVIVNDSDLTALRLTKAFSVLDNGFPHNDSLLKIMIVGRWYKMNRRANEPDIHFGSNTRGTFSLINKNGQIIKIEFNYYVIDRVITITWQNEKNVAVKKQLQIMYDLNRMIQIRDIEGFDCWSEFKECDS
jgi:tetratricopeptide (TPR) repeat protein